MFDPFDAFDPIDPVPAPPRAGEPDGVDEQEMDDVEPDRVEATEAGTPVHEPESPRSSRRWASSARRPAQPGSTGVRSPMEEVGEPTTLDSAAAFQAELEELTTAEPAAPRAISLVDVAALRTVAFPELRRATERLRARGHDAVLVDGLDADEPAVAVLFRPDTGPLSAGSSASREPARFELLLELGTSGPQVLARLRGPDGAGAFAPLDRAPLAKVDSAWISHRFVEFVQRILVST